MACARPSGLNISRLGNILRHLTGPSPAMDIGVYHVSTDISGGKDRGTLQCQRGELHTSGQPIRVSPRARDGAGFGCLSTALRQQGSLVAWLAPNRNSSTVRVRFRCSRPQTRVQTVASRCPDPLPGAFHQRAQCRNLGGAKIQQLLAAWCTLVAVSGASRMIAHCCTAAPRPKGPKRPKLARTAPQPVRPQNRVSRLYVIRPVFPAPARGRPPRTGRAMMNGLSRSAWRGL